MAKTTSPFPSPSSAPLYLEPPRATGHRQAGLTLTTVQEVAYSSSQSVPSPGGLGCSSLGRGWAEGGGPCPVVSELHGGISWLLLEWTVPRTGQGFPPSSRSGHLALVTKPVPRGHRGLYGVLEATPWPISGGPGQLVPCCLRRQMVGAGWQRVTTVPLSHHSSQMCFLDSPSRPKCAPKSLPRSRPHWHLSSSSVAGASGPRGAGGGISCLTKPPLFLGCVTYLVLFFS